MMKKFSTDWSPWMSVPQAARLLDMKSAELRGLCLRTSRKLGTENFVQDGIAVARRGAHWRIRVHKRWTSDPTEWSDQT